MSDVPALSVVVVVHDMGREAPRTLLSLAPAYQRSIAAGDYEIIVVDNGSAVPLEQRQVAEIAPNARLIRIDDAPASPALAINRGLAEARGDVIGVMIDGARIATPGLLHAARNGASLYENAVVATLGWYVGHDLQGWAHAAGYDAAREDALLASIAWPSDGYRLFEIGTMDESSGDGWFQPIAESNALFLARRLWDALGGVDERFASAGGGLLNLDTFRRAVELPGSEPVIPLGEATFHQLHGGINTNASPERQLEHLAAWSAEYERISGQPYAAPEYRAPTFIGKLPQAALVRLVHAARHPLRGRPSPLGALLHGPTVVTTAARPPSDAVDRVVALAAEEFRQGRPVAAAAAARVARTSAPDQPEILHILALAGSGLPADGPSASDAAGCYRAAGAAHRLLGDYAAAETMLQRALSFEPDLPAAHQDLAWIRLPGDDYLIWLDRLYRALQPRSVLEIGVYEGASLALVQPPAVAIGVDPAPRLLQTPVAETHIFAETSDEFFANGHAAAVLGGHPLAIGFIDGLHLFEQALRDFIGLEALCGPGSMIVMHDTIPLDEATQSRERRTGFHTGDVWKAVLCLKHYRPDLRISTIAAWPSGLTLISGLNPASRELVDRYDEAVQRFLWTPFAEIDADRGGCLNIVANDWAAVEPLLPPRREPAPGGIGARRPVAGGSFVIDRDQPPLSPDDVAAVARFHQLYYGRWQAGADTITTSWFGYQTLKCPLDLWMYQELLVRTRPDVVIETGTYAGGSALYLATVFDMLGHGRVITIDTAARPGRPVHPRIEYITASSTDPKVIARLQNVTQHERPMVILDSDHHAAHVYQELVAYSPMVRAGDYLIVEDTNINGHPAYADFGHGPMEGLQHFLAHHEGFEIDPRCERFLMTLNPKGYLRRSHA